MHFNRMSRPLAAAVAWPTTLLFSTAFASPEVLAQSDHGRFPSELIFTAERDHRNMMEQDGTRAWRPGADPKARGTFDEANADSGVIEKRDAKWVDARGIFMAAMATGQIYLLLEKQALEDKVSSLNTVEKSEQDESSAERPVPRTDRNSMVAHEQLLEKAKKGRIDVYFLGDSITRRWGTSDKQYRAFLENWRQNFFGWNAANFGWGGDTTQNILWRIQNGEFDHVNPKVIVLMAGTNNVGSTPPSSRDDPRVEQVTRGIKAILEVCRSKAPHALIVLMGITPRNDNIAVMSIINRINEHIAQLVDGKKIRYLNINDRLADKEGRLFEGMATDGLHLDVKGYQVWADALKPILKELLGPPSKEDHAPPPTGDPSAAKR